MKIPESLEEKLRRKAKAANVPVSEIVRRALTREMESDSVNLLNFPFAFRSLGITMRHTVKPLTVKIPEALEEKLRNKAKAANVPVSEIVRRALTREMESDAIDFSKLAAPYVGMFFGPADLSTHEGY